MFGEAVVAQYESRSHRRRWTKVLHLNVAFRIPISPISRVSNPEKETVVSLASYSIYPLARRLPISSSSVSFSVCSSNNIVT